MDSQYSGSLVGDDYSENSMETHAVDDSSITTEERDENSSEEEQSSITTENSSDEELDPWTTLINDAASKVRDQYEDMTKAKRKRKLLKKFYLYSKRIWAMSTRTIWHG